MRGELRSPAFSPVLAGVASARIREKQAAFTATTLLLRYAEPLMTMARLAGGSGSAAGELVRRAWKQLFHNQAHDSAAGCGVDAAHEDVKARYRWAEQLATAPRATRRSAQLRVDLPAGAAAYAVAFNPGPRVPAVMVETTVPVALVEEGVAARGPDGVLRPIQVLGGGENRPHLRGRVPRQRARAVPRRRRSEARRCSASTCRASPRPRPRRARCALDVGLGDTPVDSGVARRRSAARRAAA